MMDDEQTTESTDCAQAAALSASSWGNFDQTMRAQALSIAHDREMPAEQVVERATAYANFIIG